MLARYRLILLASLLLGVGSHRYFQKRIPNGDNVPHPCKPNHLWEGVGHFLEAGSGYRNLFGDDFAKENFTWTDYLCREDSDGDGLTNGEELGDPNCEWKEGEQPKQLTGLSHPGVCEPYDSLQCRNKVTNHPAYSTQEKWMEDMCKPGTFECEQIHQPEVRNLSLRFPPTSVPANDTTYICYIWDLSKEGLPEGDFHMIGQQPIIDNKNVMHHVLVYACQDGVETLDEPYDCETYPHEKCKTFISSWALGMSGDCYHPEAGISIGRNGYKKLAMQSHWTNFEKRSDYVDSSGLTLFYTPKKRPHEAGILILGSYYFYLPPHRESVAISSRCTSGCTKRILTGPIYIYKAWNHMHLAGRSGRVEIIRDNKHLMNLTNEPIYSYDRSKIYNYTDEPVVLLPGDELHTMCGYTTRWRKTTTFYGKSTKDEMCNGYIHFYPQKNLKKSICMDSFEKSWCDRTTLGKCAESEWFRKASLKESSLYKDIIANCRSYTPCLEECVDTIVHYATTDPCMHGDYWQFVQATFLLWTQEGKTLLSYLASCKVEVRDALRSKGYTEVISM